MKLHSQVKVIRPSHNLHVGQVVTVVELIDEHHVRVELGYVCKVVNKSDLKEIHQK